jgi:DNA ligase-1
VAGLPDFPLDGELWLGRKAFQRTVSIVRRQDQSELWREITFVVFDAPGVEAIFETRQAFLQATFQEYKPRFARVLKQTHCDGPSHLREALAQVESIGGEGLMLRQPNSRYEAHRSPTLLKVKTFHDADARVIEQLPGRGRHKGRLGALAVELPDGTRFSVGTGFTDRQRENPPAIGSTITFRFQELTDGGVPRFPSFLRIRRDAVAMAIDVPHARTNPLCSTREDHPMQTRHFEFIGGNSRKFWEVTVNSTGVTVRYGRIGSAGQTSTKSFADEAAAHRHAEKLIASKTKKGYTETVFQ